MSSRELRGGRLHRWIRPILLAWLLGAFGGAAATLPSPTTSGFHIEPDPRPPIAGERARYDERFVTQIEEGMVHSPALIALSDGGLRAFWNGGSHEAARGTAIYDAVLNPDTGVWGPARRVLTAAGTGRKVQRFIAKLGNPAVVRDREARLWLFYVSVSVGGWSGSAINVTTSSDEGESWDSPRRLISSPFFNLSTLVKGPPFLFADGAIGLPAYHELVGKFGELLRLDSRGRVIMKQRLSRGASAIQPVIVPMDPTDAVGFMRARRGRSGGQVWGFSSVDGGRSWSRPARTDLFNPDAAVAGIRLSPHELLLVINPSLTDRSVLSLWYSPDRGLSWRFVHSFEPAPPPGGEGLTYSYPAVIRTSDGDFHVLYSWRRTAIKHVSFNRAWLRSLL